MKKIILTAMAFVAMMGATAQNTITPVDIAESYTGIHYQSIPRMFSFNNVPYILSEHKDNQSGWGYDSVYFFDQNLQHVKTLPRIFEIEGRECSVETIEFKDFDVDYYDEEWVQIQYSQTLFNSDEMFEYVLPVKNSNNKDVGFNVVNEQGTIIYTFEFAHPSESSSGIGLFRIGGVFYIQIMYSHRYEGGYVENEFDLYRIDRQTQSIARVENVPFNVFPTVAERNSEITVLLEEGTNAREIVVVDAMGREVRSVPVAQGQREVKVSTQGLGAGMGFVSDRKNGAVKIIVR